eukprot:CAMPEP_0117432902 /NCGR_PEP_ID=MMETSP0758-20121206/12329_1 /TAXON_ID=63605 /ORGANISM="Percolomonas cosmopolitus, Strain AE-1 (ATCC 50343)" /LENGTH=1046 /DNA_ID=CAMNT_0005223161 /DNA_START=53 /DNA_END=3190 /DNA_ORIENTATION=-
MPDLPMTLAVPPWQLEQLDCFERCKEKLRTIKAKPTQDYWNVLDYKWVTRRHRKLKRFRTCDLHKNLDSLTRDFFFDANDNPVRHRVFLPIKNEIEKTLKALNYKRVDEQDEEKEFDSSSDYSDDDKMIEMKFPQHSGEHMMDDDKLEHETPKEKATTSIENEVEDGASEDELEDDLSETASTEDGLTEDILTDYESDEEIAEEIYDGDIEEEEVNVQPSPELKKLKKIFIRDLKPIENEDPKENPTYVVREEEDKMVDDIDVEELNLDTLEDNHIIDDDIIIPDISDYLDVVDPEKQNPHDFFSFDESYDILYVPKEKTEPSLRCASDVIIRVSELYRNIKNDIYQKRCCLKGCDRKIDTEFKKQKSSVVFLDFIHFGNIRKHHIRYCELRVCPAHFRRYATATYKYKLIANEETFKRFTLQRKKRNLFIFSQYFTTYHNIITSASFSTFVWGRRGKHVVETLGNIPEYRDNVQCQELCCIKNCFNQIRPYGPKHTFRVWNGFRRRHKARYIYEIPCVNLSRIMKQLYLDNMLLCICPSHYKSYYRYFELIGRPITIQYRQLSYISQLRINLAHKLPEIKERIDKYIKYFRLRLLRNEYALRRIRKNVRFVDPRPYKIKITNYLLNSDPNIRGVKFAEKNHKRKRKRKTGAIEPKKEDDDEEDLKKLFAKIESPSSDDEEDEGILDDQANSPFMVQSPEQDETKEGTTSHSPIKKVQKRLKPIGEQLECCIKGCTTKPEGYTRFSMRYIKDEDIKQGYPEKNWNYVCSPHYYLDLNKYRKNKSENNVEKEIDGFTVEGVDSSHLVRKSTEELYHMIDAAGTVKGLDAHDSDDDKMQDDVVESKSPDLLYEDDEEEENESEGEDHDEKEEEEELFYIVENGQLVYFNDAREAIKRKYAMRRAYRKSYIHDLEDIIIHRIKKDCGDQEAIEKENEDENDAKDDEELSSDGEREKEMEEEELSKLPESKYYFSYEKLPIRFVNETNHYFPEDQVESYVPIQTNDIKFITHKMVNGEVVHDSRDENYDVVMENGEVVHVKIKDDMKKGK